MHPYILSFTSWLHMWCGKIFHDKVWNILSCHILFTHGRWIYWEYSMAWHGIFLTILSCLLELVHMLTCSHEHVHMNLLTHSPINVIAFEKPIMIKTSALVLKVKHLPSSSNDQKKPLAEFIDSRWWATFARFRGCTFNNQTFCLLKVCELLPNTTVKNTCFVINWVEV